MALLRVGIVGASSLMGKELAEELGGSGSELGVVDLVLLDEGDAAGQVTAAGDEASFVQRIEAGSFEGMGLCFFAGTAEETRRHWGAAARAGAGVVDLTDALAGEDGVMVRAPWMGEAMGRRVRAVLPVHPVAAMLGLVAARCAGLGLTAVAATVLEPASERGTAGVDEMHQQTVKLLSFQSVPRVEFDAQVAFNLLPALGAGARVSMGATARRIGEEYRVAGGGALAPMSLQMVHAPVFHGYGISVLLEFQEVVDGKAIEAALAGAYVEVVTDRDEAPSTVSVAGQGKIFVNVGEGEETRVWLWVVADNLKLRALLAIACGAGLHGVSARGTVQ